MKENFEDHRTCPDQFIRLQPPKQAVLIHIARDLFELTNFIVIIKLCTLDVVSEFQVIETDWDAPLLTAGYHCDYEDPPCICPFDQLSVQSFGSHHLYKRHMQDIHGTLPCQKRKVTAPVSSATKEKRRLVTTRRHQEGAFLNTHIKKQVLVEFIELYDRFMQDLFNSDEYSGNDFKTTWIRNFRITASVLKELPLEELIEGIKEGSFSNYFSKRFRWLQRELED